MRYSQAIKYDDELNIISLTYHSINYLITADRFVKTAKELETKYIKKFDSKITSELNSYVNSSILSIIAFLESIINEILHDLCDEDSFQMKNISTKTKEVFKNLNDINIPKRNSYSTLEKYEFVIKLIKNQTFKKGIRPYQDVKLLIQLRNALTHYKPEWKNSSNDQFYNELSGKFELNPFFDKKEPFFPFRCLSAGCAEWALNSVLQFTDEFYKRIEIEPIYRHVRKKLN